MALVVAALGVLAVAVPGAGKFFAIGLGLVAVVAGVSAYRQRAARAGRRLAGAAGIAFGSVALFLGAAKVILTLVAIERLGLMFR
jgi:hypothetical protein